MTVGCILIIKGYLTTMIKFTNLPRCWQELKTELLPAYEEIQQSGQVCNGKYRELVEQQLKAITGRKHCRLTTSGTTAIHGALISRRRVKILMILNTLSGGGTSYLSGQV